MKINPLIEIEDLEGRPIPERGDNDIAVQQIVGILKTAAKEPAGALIQIAQAIKNNAESDKAFTLKNACVTALQIQFDDEKGLSGEDKFKRHKLVEKIYAAKGEIDMTVEEVTLVKKIIGKAYGTLIVGRCWELLEDGPKVLEEPDAPKVRKTEKR